jgi:pilus retraction protein PilT
MKLSDIIRQIASLGQSFTDIHIETDMPIMLRISFGEWQEYRGSDDQPVIVSHPAILGFINGIFTGREDIRKEEEGGMPWKHRLDKLGSLHPAMTIWDEPPAPGMPPYMLRMRCSIQRQNMGETLAIMVRPLPEVPNSVEELGLPIQVNQLVASATQGLIVVTGPTGSGKSTTIAAMVEAINRTRPVNILTIEEPIEYIYTRKRAIINQRELLVDCPSFAHGVKDAMRFVPEVIVVGEIRDKETMAATLRAAESGHLVLTTMHAPTTVGAIRKMVSLLEGSAADSQVLMSSLVAVIAQALLRRADDDDGTNLRSNALAYEYLNVKDKAVAQYLTDAWKEESSLNKLEDALRRGGMPGGKCMTEVLRGLVEQKRVAKKNAALVCPYVEDRTSLLNM